MATNSIPIEEMLKRRGITSISPTASLPDSVAPQVQTPQDSPTSIPIDAILAKRGIKPTDPASIKVGEKPEKGWFQNWVAPVVRTGMIDAGIAGGTGLSLASTPLTGPAGPAMAAGAGVLGGVAGDQAYQQILQRFLPQYFGERQPGVLDSLQESGEQGALNTGVGTGTKLIGKGASTVKSKLLKSFFPINPVPEVQGALTDAVGQKLNPTVAQYTQSELAQFAEDNLKGQAKRELFAQQQPLIQKEVKGLLGDVSGGRFNGIKTAETSPSMIGAEGKSDAKAMFDAAKNSEKARWNNLLQNEVPNVTDSATNGIKIEGPVYANKTQDFARGVSQQLEDAITKENNSGAPNPDTLAYLQKLKAKVDPYTTLPSSGTNGQPVLNFTQAKDDKDLFYRLANNKDVPPEIKREVGLVGALGDLLGGDIKDSVNSSWPTSARRAFNGATAKTKSIAEAFYGNKNTGILDPGTNSEAAIADALKNPEAASIFRKQTGSRSLLGTEYLRNILDKAQDTNGYFDGNKAAKMFSDTGDIAKEALTANQRTAFTNLVKRMQGVDPKLVERGNVALAFRYGSAIFGLAGGALTSLKTGSVSDGVMAGTGLLATIQMSKHAIENVMLNPNTARMMANLSHLPPQSSQAQSLTKYLFKTALKGETVSLLDPKTGEKTQGIIGEDGKITPVGQ